MGGWHGRGVARSGLRALRPARGPRCSALVGPRMLCRRTALGGAGGGRHPASGRQPSPLRSPPSTPSSPTSPPSAPAHDRRRARGRPGAAVPRGDRGGGRRPEIQRPAPRSSREYKEGGEGVEAWREGERAAARGARRRRRSPSLLLSRSCSTWTPRCAPSRPAPRTWNRRPASRPHLLPLRVPRRRRRPPARRA